MKSQEYFAELNRKLIDLDIRNSVSTLLFHLEQFLSPVTAEQIEEAKIDIEDNIVVYYEIEKEGEIKRVKDLYLRNMNDEEDYYYNNSYSKYFCFDCRGNLITDETWIVEDFEIPIREDNEDYESLRWILELGYFENCKTKLPDSAIMAVQACIYIEKLINDQTKIIHLSNAFLAFRYAEDMENEFYKKRELLAAKHNARQEIIEKAIKARHLESNQKKELVIQRWRRYKKQMLDQGKTPSKTQFAQKIFNDLLNAHKKDPEKNKSYSFKTIRNNWLQGID